MAVFFACLMYFVSFMMILGIAHDAGKPRRDELRTSSIMAFIAVVLAVGATAIF